LKQLFYIEILTIIALLFLWWSVSAGGRRSLGMNGFMFVLALPTIMFLSPNLPILHFITACAFFIAARRVEQAVGFYLLSLLLMPPFGNDVNISGVYLFHLTIHSTLAITALISWIVHSKGRARGLGLYDVPIIIVFIVLLYPSLTDEMASPTVALRSLVQFVLNYGVPYYFLSRAVRNWEAVRNVGLYLTAGAVVVSVVLIYEAYSYWPLYRGAYTHFGIDLGQGLGVKIRSGLMRSGGPFLEPTSMAFALALLFFAALCSRSWFKGIGHYGVALGLISAGLLAPQSRGAWVAVVLGIIAMPLYQRRYAAAATRFLVLGVSGLTLLFVAGTNRQVGQLLGVSGDALGTVDYRKKLLTRGLEEFWLNPYLGQPPSSVYKRLSDLTQGEGIIDFVNFYLYTALVSGAVGLVLLAVALLIPVIWMWQGAKLITKVQRQAGAFVFAGILVPLEMLAFTSFDGRPAILYFLFVGLAGAIASFPPIPSARFGRAVPPPPSKGATA
jgi:O-antigen ligase